MDEVFDKFIENIYTKEDLSVLLDQIEQAARSVYKGGDTVFSEKIKGVVSEEFRGLIASLEGAGKFPGGDEEQSEFFKDLKKYLGGLPVVRITIAFKPSQDFISNMSEWLKKQIGKRIILEILVKEDLVGGLIVEYGGEYRDFSLARKLDEIIESSRPKEQISATIARSVTK